MDDATSRCVASTPVQGTERSCRNEPREGRKKGREVEMVR
jgi:hypothetical protein